MASYEPPQKKARPYEANGTQNGVQQQAANGYQNGVVEQQHIHQFTNTQQMHVVADEHGMLAPALGSKTKPCTKFFSTSGCPYGEGCHFLHYVPGGIAALGLAPLSNVNTSSLAAGVARTSVGGTTVLGQGQLTATAPNADPSVTVGGYKTRLCNRFNTPEGCRFGEKCHFAHGESDLRPSNTRSSGRLAAATVLDYSGQIGAGSTGGIYANGAVPPYISPAVASALYYGEPTPPGVSTASGFGITSTTKISIEAVFAGAIIGKAGSNVKQISRLTGAKLSIREHETDPNMRNVEMEGSLEQIESASEMVRQFLQNREVVTPKTAALGSHNFKTKMCENFVQGTCTFADRCHFAHGQSELRGPVTAMR